MTVIAAQDALIQYVLDAPGRPPVGHPRKAAPPITTADPVRWVVQPSAAAPRTITLKGLVRANVEIVLRVEAADNRADLVEASVADVEQRFAVGTRIDGRWVVEAPNPRPPLVGDGIYAVPVVIRAVTHY